jgi:hypothetical protein
MSITDRQSSVSWNRFWNDLSKAMIMTDPIAYSWYMVWTREAQGRGEPDTAPGRARQRETDGLRVRGAVV